MPLNIQWMEMHPITGLQNPMWLMLSFALLCTNHNCQNQWILQDVVDGQHNKRTTNCRCSTTEHVQVQQANSRHRFSINPHHRRFLSFPSMQHNRDETFLGTFAQRLGRMRWTWMATNKSATYSDDGLSCWKTQRLKMSLPSSGRRTLASPSTHTFGASGRILPQLIASRRRAPDRLPSCSGAVVT